ncbi:MAG: phosphoglycolate phosphatase [Steroidobacterales bacterium]
MLRPLDETTLAPAQWRERPLFAVLFDLDGTLLDTAGDIALALNRSIAEFGWSPVPADEVRHMIGRGAPILVERAAASQQRALSDQMHSAMIERFFHHYGALEESGESATQPFGGAAEALRRLHAAGVRIAVVTNKQHRFAEALLRLLGLIGWVDCVVGGDTCERRKPDPQPLLFACQSLGVSASQALMVGDSINDVQAARAAGIPVVCVPHGYNEGKDPRTLPCDTLIEHLSDLPGMLLHAAQPA